MTSSQETGNSSHTCCPDSIWVATDEAGLLWLSGGIGMRKDDNPVTCTTFRYHTDIITDRSGWDSDI